MNHYKKNDPVKRRLNFTTKNKSLIFSALVAIGGGMLLLLSSLASTLTTSKETESATLSNNTKVYDDTTASGGQYIKFEDDSLAASWQSAWDTRDYTTIREWYRNNTGINAAGLTESDLEIVDGNVESTHDGQIIEGLFVRSGQVRIRHDNVTVKNSKIVGESYGIDVRYSDRDAVNQFFVENVSVVGDAQAAEDPFTIPDRGISGQYATVHAKNVYVAIRGGGMRLCACDNNSVEYSMVEDIRTGQYYDSGGNVKNSHNTGISFRGGSGTTLYRNWIEGSSSSGTALYADGSPITYFTGSQNLFDKGTYGAHGGYAKTYKDQNHHIVYKDNLFVKGSFGSGPYKNVNKSQTGNKWENNYYLDGEHIP